MPSRTITVSVKGFRHQIPEAWLVGRAQAREREGLEPRAAFLQAIADWIEQARLERSARAKVA